VTSTSHLRNPWHNRWTPENVIKEPEELRAYRFGAQTPKLAIRPSSDQEIAEIVRFAAAEKFALAPTCARTKLAMNVSVREYDVAIDVSRLDRVLAYDPGDLTLSVEAGAPLRKLADLLAEHRQFLPLAVPFEDRATIGGTIAAGIDSPLRQFYGTARDYVLGMEFVTGDGQVVKSGGRVVKNVSGYDLHKLMIGSYGSLGVITKVNLRTFPAPTSLRGFLACFDSAADAVGMRNRIAQSPLRPLTLEILSPSAAELSFRDLFPTRSKNTWTLLVTFSGTEKIIERYKGELRRLAGGADAALLEEREAAARLARVREFISIVLRSAPETAIVKMGVLPGQMARVLDEAASISAKQELPSAAIARGVGVIYFALLSTVSDEESRLRVVTALDELAEAVERCDGNFTVPWAPEKWRGAMAARKTNGDELALMREIKRAFDPQGAFAPDPFGAWI
jgi:glycolate oxidase FAD binding subunit